MCDIAVFDWPVFRPHVELALYGDEAPVPAAVHWDRIDADGFERLLARLLEQSSTYTNINRVVAENVVRAGEAAWWYSLRMPPSRCRRRISSRVTAA